MQTHDDALTAYSLALLIGVVAGRRDLPAALIEDVIAIGGALLIGMALP